MTIRRDEGQWWAECDDCGDWHDLAGPTFRDCVAELGEAGWRIQGPSGVTAGEGWTHTCPGCLEALRGDFGDEREYER